jgi:hypothetical protein
MRSASIALPPRLQFEQSVNAVAAAATWTANGREPGRHESSGGTTASASRPTTTSWTRAPMARLHGTRVTGGYSATVNRMPARPKRSRSVVPSTVAGVW